jgi:hypothetical protein
VIQLWDTAFGGTAADLASSILPTKDGGYFLAGTSYSNKSGDKTEQAPGVSYWVVKLDKNRKKEWDNTLSGDITDGHTYVFDDLLSAQQTQDGGFILSGRSRSGKGNDKTVYPGGAYNHWIIKLNANGIKEWDRAYGAFGNTHFEPSIIRETTSGQYILAGWSIHIRSSYPENYNFWIGKLDYNGDVLWEKTIGGGMIGNGIRKDVLTALEICSDGGIIVGGRSRSSACNGTNGRPNYECIKSQDSRGDDDFWIAKINSSGRVIEWEKTYGGSGKEEPTSIIETHNGGYIIGGYSNSGIGQEKSENSKGQNDLWIIQIDAHGNKIWDKTIGGSGDDYLNKVIQTYDGGFLLSGTVSSPKGGDITDPKAIGISKYWILKLDEQGNKVWDKILESYYTSIYAPSRFGGLHEVNPGEYILGGSVTGGRPNRGGWDYWLTSFFDCNVLIPTISQNGSLLRSSQAQAGNQWLDATRQPIPQATGSSYAPPASGTYYVQYRSPQGCVVTSPPYTYIQGCDGQPEGFFSIQQLAGGRSFRITTPQDVPVNRRNYTARLLDPLTGQVRYSTPLSGLNFEITVSSNLAQGPYTLEVKGELDTLTLAVHLP